MKFGDYLKNRLYLPWQNYYVNYDLLKKQIKNKEDKKFWNIIECELTKVNLFYNYLEQNNNVINNEIKDKQQHLYDYVILNYMAIFKAIKKYEKRLCKSAKIHFFNLMQKQDFYKKYLEQPRSVKPTKLVIFDKDGTLIFIKKLFVNWFHKFVSNMSESIVDLDEFYQFVGFDKNTNYFKCNSEVAKGTSDTIRNKLIEYLHTKFIEKSEEHLLHYVKSHWPVMEISHNTIETCCDLEKLFLTLTEKNIKIAICTSDDRYYTIKTLKLLGLTKYIDMIVCGDDIISSKPSPEPIWHICNTLNTNPNETIMIGDTISDVHAGINAKCGMVYGVLTGGYDSHELEKCDKILNNVSEIVDHLVLPVNNQKIHKKKTIIYNI